jgi:hypothetical protein
MKKIILLSLLFTTFSCKPQSKKQTEVEKITHNKMENKHEYNKLVNKGLEKFDIKRFDENKEEGETYRYTTTEGDEITESGGLDSGEHLVTIIPKNSLYYISKLFYPNSNIKCKGPSFKDDCEIGIWYDFDEKGKLIKSTDLDEPYKLTIEHMLHFLKKSNADFARYFSINRVFDENKKIGTWTLIFDGTYKNNQGKYLIEIDDKTNEIQYVAKITGKEGEKEILKNKKKETLLIDEDNSKNNNNLILITLLFLALALIVGGLIYISQRSQIPSP